MIIEKTEQRLHSLDYLRAIAAIGIMVFHYTRYNTSDYYDAASVIERIGQYGVSIFYVLSGLTLYHVYQNSIKSSDSIGRFYVKRIFRLYPILWLLVIGNIIRTMSHHDFSEIFLVLSGLFGFVKWDSSLGGGIIWSVGNEIVFYSIFPLFVILSQKHKHSFRVVIAIITSIYLYYTFIVLKTTHTSRYYWHVTTNPLNNLFYFFSGYLLGLYFSKVRIAPIQNMLLLLAAIVLFIFHPASGNTINIISGFNRVIFTGICIIICFCFYKNSYALPQVIDSSLSFLGKISYSIYMLHSIIWSLTDKFFWSYYVNKPFVLQFALASIATLIVSYTTYNTIEKPFIRIGGKLALKLFPEQKL